MKTRATLSLFVLLILLVGFLCAEAQEVTSNAQAEPQFSAYSRLSNGLRVAFATQTEPPGAIHFGTSVVETQSGFSGIHRAFVDIGAGFFFGYDVKVEPEPDSKHIKVLIQPMSTDFEQRLRQRAEFKIPMVHPDFNTASLFQNQTEHLVSDGDLVSIVALVNPRTGVKIVETIKVSYAEIPLGSSATAGSTRGLGVGVAAAGGAGAVAGSSDASKIRDFSIDDVQMRVFNYRLLLNGELIAGAKPTGGCGGAVIWFYAPGRGRFILSLQPHEGYDFQKIGVIDNDQISFTIGADQYQWISNAPVVPVGGRFGLWVLHDIDYRPELDRHAAWLMSERNRVGQSGPSSKETAGLGVIIGAANGVDFLLQKK